MFELLKSLFEVKNFGITNEDLKSGAASKNIYDQKEVVAKISIPTFKGVNGDYSIRKFPYMFQDGSSSCVAFTMAKIVMILYYLIYKRIVRWSSKFWYARRINKPNEGMNFFNIVDLASEGAITEELLPSNGLSEAEMNDASEIKDYIKDVADGFAVSKNWIEMALDFNTVASTIEATKKPIMLWFSFGPSEFFGELYPMIKSYLKPWKHSVTATDTTTINGKQYIVIEDSADNELYYQKFISREFFDRCFLARYPINFKFNEPSIIKPSYIFLKNLSFGMTDPDIKMLQDILKFEGLMKTIDNAPSTNYFGLLTKNALIAFQKKYSITPAEGYLGNITRSKLNELYGR